MDFCVWARRLTHRWSLPSLSLALLACPSFVSSATLRFLSIPEYSRSAPSLLYSVPASSELLLDTHDDVTQAVAAIALSEPLSSRDSASIPTSTCRQTLRYSSTRTPLASGHFYPRSIFNQDCRGGLLSSTCLRLSTRHGHSPSLTVSTHPQTQHFQLNHDSSALLLLPIEPKAVALSAYLQSPVAQATTR